MQQALDLAWKGQGFVEPNPMVGCVIVKRGRTVGRGFHGRFGGPHAEPNALRAAAGGAGGATVYVTLEPCCETAKTPPCCDALIRAGVRRVVVAMKDPHARVAGRGLKMLRAAGIRVNLGLLRDEAVTLNAPFITYHTQRRPYVILKWAQSIDGKIATRTGDSRWITSRQSRTAAHALRARVDAVLVGVNTVIADDPALTARRARPRRLAARIVLDAGLRTPLPAKLVRTARTTPTVIVTDARHAGPLGRTRRGQPKAADRSRKLLQLRRAGCEVLPIAGDTSGIRLPALLRALHGRGVTNLLVEGGGRVLGAFLGARLADEAHIFVAPILIGGEAAPGPLRHGGPGSIRDLPGTRVRSLIEVGPDLCYTVVFG